MQIVFEAGWEKTIDVLVRDNPGSNINDYAGWRAGWNNNAGNPNVMHLRAGMVGDWRYSNESATTQKVWIRGLYKEAEVEPGRPYVAAEWRRHKRRPPFR